MAAPGTLQVDRLKKSVFSRRHSSGGTWKTGTAWGRVLGKPPGMRTDADIKTLFSWVKEQKIKFFETLEDKLVLQLCRVMRVDERQKGDVIIRQGNKGSRFFVIVHGSVSVFVKVAKEDADDEGGPQDDGETLLGCKVAELKAGVGFGELALLQDVTRTASIVCRQHSVFVTVDKTNYIQALRQLHVAKMNKVVSWLRNNFLFTRWSHQKCVSFSYALVPHSLPRNEVLYRQGDATDTIYMIRSGECLLHKTVTTVADLTVYPKTADQQHQLRQRTEPRTSRLATPLPPFEPFIVELATIGEQEFVGAMEVTRQLPFRCTTVTAVTDLEYYELKESHLHTYITRGPTLRTIRRILASRDRHHSRRVRHTYELRASSSSASSEAALARSHHSGTRRPPSSAAMRRVRAVPQPALSPQVAARFRVPGPAPETPPHRRADHRGDGAEEKEDDGGHEQQRQAPRPRTGVPLSPRRVAHASLGELLAPPTHKLRVRSVPNSPTRPASARLATTTRDGRRRRLSGHMAAIAYAAQEATGRTDETSVLAQQLAHTVGLLDG